MLLSTLIGQFNYSEASDSSMQKISGVIV